MVESLSVQEEWDLLLSPVPKSLVVVIPEADQEIKDLSAENRNQPLQQLLLTVPAKKMPKRRGRDVRSLHLKENSVRNRKEGKKEKKKNKKIEDKERRMKDEERSNGNQLSRAMNKKVKQNLSL